MNCKACLMMSLVLVVPSRATAYAPEEPGGPLPAQAVEMPGAGADAAVANYAVEEGEDLYSVALLCGASIARLKEMNGLSGTDLNPGQRIMIPTGNLPANVADELRKKAAQEIAEAAADSSQAAPADDGAAPADAAAAEPCLSSLSEASGSVDSGIVAASLPSTDPVQGPQQEPAAGAPATVEKKPGEDPAMAASPTVKKGDPREAVIAAWGEPRGFAKQTSFEVLTYAQGLVFLQNGKVVDVKPSSRSLPVRAASCASSGGQWPLVAVP